MKIALFGNKFNDFEYNIILAEEGVPKDMYRNRISEWAEVEFTMLPKDQMSVIYSDEEKKDNEIQRLTGIADRLRGYYARSKNEWYLQGYSEQVELEAAMDAKTNKVEF